MFTLVLPKDEQRATIPKKKKVSTQELEQPKLDRNSFSEKIESPQKIEITVQQTIQPVKEESP